MAGGTLLDRIERAKRDQQRVGEETMRQFMADMYCLALNDPEVMGRDVLGYNRLQKVLEGAIRYYDMYHDALTLSPEADYCQAKLDDRMRQIIPADKFAHFEERYPRIIPEKYTRRR